MTNLLSPSRRPGGRRVAAAAVLGLAATVAAGATASGATAKQDDLGPVLTRTDAGPTGYEVTFRFDAPDATAVSLTGDVYFTDPAHINPFTFASDARLGDEWQPGDVAMPSVGAPAPLTKGEDGVWEITVAMPAGAYNYGFIVGECAAAAYCASSYDPASPPVFADVDGAASQALSQIYVPEHDGFPTYSASYQGPVAHPLLSGSVSHVVYDTPNMADGDNAMGVYLPAGYDASRAEPYPLLVLQHGGGGSETDWFSQGQAGAILDNAIATGTIEPTVVVSTNAIGLDSAFGDEFVDGYAAELADVVLPYIDTHYNVSADVEDRAFGGLSAGGRAGVNLLHHHPDMFGYYGLWSAAADWWASEPLELTEQQAANAASATRVHVGTGLQDYLLGIGAKSVLRADMYRDLGLDVVEHNVDGSHTWQVWREELGAFLAESGFASPDPDCASTSIGKGSTGSRGAAALLRNAACGIGAAHGAAFPVVTG
ncbi:alpha/beta hydrolase-fold protein [Demequina rhizosphaerae]|uniref:alpha/beta hydrolase-fold protein n=1 Tax=Demequina rhizosphaerae TaxID=1638985 RepID=UPI000782474F|nr:alpha/beta hydrolase-fold protein [Demequina rhizosphaerae]